MADDFATGDTDPAPPLVDNRPRIGVDLSHHIDPAAIDWEALSERCTWVIVRATYGTRRDRACVEHVRRARQVALQVGLYAFYRPRELVTDQVEAFGEAAAACGLSPGDVCPAVDVEDDPSPYLQSVCDAWAPLVRTILDEFGLRWGESLLYCNLDTWKRLGSPVWVLRRPLWWAEWQTPHPHVPGGAQPRIWQRHVGEMAGVLRGPVDQNVAFGPLPTIPYPDNIPPRDRPRLEGLIALTLRSTLA